MQLKNINKPKDLALAYYYYGSHFLKLDKKKQALDFLNLSKEILDNGILDKKLSKNIYIKLEEIYTRLEQYEKALEYAKLLKKIEKELKTPETLQYLAINEAEYNFRIKEEKVNLEHQSKLQKQKEFKIIFLASALLLLIITGLIFYELTQKNKRNKFLKKANETRDKMFRLIAHDFRSPLISISNTVHLIPFKVKKKNYDSIIELCKEVTNSVNRVLSLIDNLINWTLSQNDNIPYNPANHNLIEIIEEIIEIYKPIAGYKKIKINNLIEKNYSIYADKNILNTVFRNLINNAIKFTPEMGEISINAEESTSNIKIIVKDSGIGISKDKIKSLFSIHKEKGEGTKGEKGNGLGLFFCKEFVKKNKGEIWVDSEQGQGSSFYFTVPLSKL